MNIHGTCTREGCDFHFEDAEHCEDAVAKLRAHYRMDHPTKAFYETHHLENIEQYNMTFDEQVGRHTGVPDWRERIDGERGIARRHVVSACQAITRHHRYYQPAVVDEALALAAEYGTPIPDPRNENADAPAAPDQVLAYQLAQDMLAEMPPDEEEPF